MRRRRIPADPIDRGRFPLDPWRLVEEDLRTDDLGVTETLFSVANGYLGMRGNPDEGRDSHTHGTFINGFHETWPIQHAEAAFGFARTGQTIVNVPDAKVIKLYVDDEPLLLATADLEHYQRSLDFRDGILRRSLIWRTPAGKRLRINTTRMVSMTERHLAMMTFEITMLSGDAPIVLSSQLLNRQDGRDEYHVPSAAMGSGFDPRRSSVFTDRVLLPQLSQAAGERLMLGYRCARSGMTLAVGADHRVECESDYDVLLRHEDDLAKLVLRAELTEGSTLRLEKVVAYHTSRGVPVRELTDRCERTLSRAASHGVEHYQREQRAWFDGFWERADVQVDGDPAAQQAIRFNLFSLAQATARSDQMGVPAKGVTGSGYEGHYFWDTEVYVVPFLSYTDPDVARNVLHFRTRMLPAARERAAEMANRGAMFPWRTINGEEASAYYAAGTAQVHIDADIAFALAKYVWVSGDEGFAVREGIDVVVETARMWADLGFWHDNGERTFHIHGVTGPDEYTTVVNNNLFTNVMARFNLEKAVQIVDYVREKYPSSYALVVSRLGLTDEEVAEWRACAEGMTIPFDAGLGIHPQDDSFLDREAWDLSRTPEDLLPLLLNYHPLVLYRFQVLKQADVVLAMFLQGDRFSPDEKLANFAYYDPITTGDSTLSPVVQSIMAAEVGYRIAAADYFREALFVDLLDLHRNTVDGVHIASAGGVWQALVFGFGGLRDHEGHLSFDPRLPDDWTAMRYRLRVRGLSLSVELTAEALSLSLECDGPRGAGVSDDGPGFVHSHELHLTVRGVDHVMLPGETLRLEMDCRGPRQTARLGKHPRTGGVRADGTRITAGVPDPVRHRDPTDADQTGELPAISLGPDDGLLSPNRTPD
ncbi:glycoside hydrolase family 65 protein [Nocardioides ferulae]|uniref:glycoside hydrolase family 65 protein n=1 Tax=Nocardioides ferulae TaxID=2340821 RepID=UPI001F0C96D0|nr:glycosyl hydrolase family 65 protein [Nocardioides ferulae]